ncbi:MAG: hypothetical protein RAO92_06560 [Candidatus Euphemobacter frigidus]|nr:hypothetical protein [Candidatus Euphemobacter frigidus]MDP8276048.1 hypothetical protein [Candidatus Euphemobacter frigidus]
MRRVIVLSAIVSLLFGVLPVRECLSGSEKESAFDRVLVSVELPPDFELLSEKRLKSCVEDIIPGGFTVEKIDRETVVISGLRSLLIELEGSGLDCSKVTLISGGSKYAGRLSRGADLAFKQNWGPLTYPGEIITDIYVDTVSGEDAVVVGTKNPDWS